MSQRGSDSTEEDEASGTEAAPKRANPIDVHVGNRVRMRRMILGMSQERLGELLKLTFQQIQKYEKGTNRIGASRLFQMSAALSVPIQYFFDDLPLGQAQQHQSGFSEQGSESEIAEFLSTREGVELYRAFIKIHDPKVRRSIIDLARSLANERDGQ